MTIERQDVQIRSLGDSALVVQLGAGIHPTIHEQVKALITFIENNPFTGFIEATPSYNTVTVFYNPVTVTIANQKKNHLPAVEIVRNFLLHAVEQGITLTIAKPRSVEIPVVYGNEFGPDLEYVSNFHGLTPEKVIELHSQIDYLVYMIGFAPGFPFLGGMDEQIATPRKNVPRLAIPSGSVGIAGKQTGVYPLETPGGWQIIGQTPVDLFLPTMNPPSRLQPGDMIRFKPITNDEYLSQKELKQ